MSKEVFAKSVGAAAQEEDGTQLGAEFSEAMQELDAFVKSNGDSAALMSKAKPFESKEEDEEEEEEMGEKPHDKDDEDMMAKAEERNMEVTTHGQTKKKKTMHAHTMHKSVEGDDDVQAMDGEEVIAGFHKSLAKVAKSVSVIMASIEQMKEENSRLTLMLAKAVRAEGNLIKAVAGEVSQMGQMARPRKSVLTVFEKSASGSVPADETKSAFDGKAFLVKSVEAAAAKRISPVQVGEIRQMLSMNQQVPEHLVKLVEGK